MDASILTKMPLSGKAFNELENVRQKCAVVRVKYHARAVSAVVNPLIISISEVLLQGGRHNGINSGSGVKHALKIEYVEQSHQG